MVLIALAASLIAMVIKRLVSRVRPGRPNAGKFLGPQLSHANFRESFPSSHSACAVAMTVVLSVIYPQGAVIFWRWRLCAPRCGISWMLIGRATCWRESL